MKATGIVRRIDDLGRVVIPKEIRRTMRIRVGDPSQTALEEWQKFGFSMLDLAKRMGWDSYISTETGRFSRHPRRDVKILAVHTRACLNGEKGVSADRRIRVRDGVFVGG